MPTGLRERKKRATMVALATAARRLTLDRGPDAVTVEDIAAAADVSPRTFFNYFSCKEAAIVGIEGPLLDELRTELIDRPAAENPVDALIAVLVNDLEASDDLARLWALRTELANRHPVLLPRLLASYAELEAALVEGLAIRLGTDPATDPYPALVVSAVVAGLRATMLWWHANGQPEPLPEVVHRAAAALSTGLAPDRK
ncbi:MAG: TetR/AcrR family transcriptional regulator [Acidimicrobiia bacterium]